MTDKHTPEARSRNMSKIKSKNTGPELLVRKYLHSAGFRFRLHDRKLPGKPDIILPKYHTAVFVNGCFWHGHAGCRYFSIPKTRTEWWHNKIKNNIRNDLSVVTELQNAGWRVIVLWGCELKKNYVAGTLEKLAANLRENLPQV